MHHNTVIHFVSTRQSGILFLLRHLQCFHSGFLMCKLKMLTKAMKRLTYCNYHKIVLFTAEPLLLWKWGIWCSCKQREDFHTHIGISLYLSSNCHQHSGKLLDIPSPVCKAGLEWNFLFSLSVCGHRRVGIHCLAFEHRCFNSDPMWAFSLASDYLLLQQNAFV